jgi:Na+-driven multidrug efflux pump
MLMSVVDNIMVGKLGAGALAAASLAHSLFMMIRFNAKSRKEIRLS